jgi:hypothetical protein
VTLKLFEVLHEIRENIEKDMVDGAIIMAPNSTQLLAKLVGYREGVDLVLTINFEDIEDDVDEETDLSGRISDLSETSAG